MLVRKPHWCWSRVVASSTCKLSLKRQKKQTDKSSNSIHHTTGMHKNTSNNPAPQVSKHTQIKYNWKEFKKTLRQLENRSNRLTQCYTQFKPPGFNILCVLYLHYNLAFTCKSYGNSWNKLFQLSLNWVQDWVSRFGLYNLDHKHLLSFVQHGWRDINWPKMTMFVGWHCRWNI